MKLSIIFFVTTLLFFFQNCSALPEGTFESQSFIDNASPASSLGSSTDLESLEKICATESDGKGVGVSLAKPLSTSEYKNTMLSLFYSIRYTGEFNSILGLVPEENIGDSLTTYLRYKKSKAVIDDERMSAYHLIAVFLANRMSMATTTSQADMWLFQFPFGFCYNHANTTPTCIDSMLNGMGLKTFRRPLSSEEFNEVKTIFQAGSTIQEGFGLAAYYFLMSPKFLLHLENDGIQQGDIVELDQYAIASKLSHALLGRISGELLEYARLNKLKTPADINAAIEMLNSNSNLSNEIKNNYQNFLYEWLKLSDSAVLDSAKTRAIAGGDINLPQVKSLLPQMMNKEVVDMFNYHFYSTTRTYKEFFTTEKSFAKTLSSSGTNYNTVSDIYRVPAWDGVGEPPLHPPGERAGFLTTAGLLSSHGDMNNPFAIGGRMFKHVLCREFTGVTSGPNVFPPPAPVTLRTTREIFESVVPRSSSCMGCHNHIEPLGMPFESFDIFGRYRGGVESAFDGAGNLIGQKSINTLHRPIIGNNRTTVLNGVDMIKQLSETSEPEACFARQLFRYTHRRMDTKADACYTARITKKLTEGSMWDAFKAVFTDPAFSKRRLD